uniref:Uncharacterized protein n=1 Tax=Alexandrium catenella TaxID=2925 RepID=A0A7S1WAK9_ALECA|mmetsp:Transcript_45702/g.122861  ORF Transcript_45702/g.122861 Transcript_45702/m.122861 type:complete len:184 (+) Transcript_45702:126-677(+)
MRCLLTVLFLAQLALGAADEACAVNEEEKAMATAMREDETGEDSALEMLQLRGNAVKTEDMETAAESAYAEARGAAANVETGVAAAEGKDEVADKEAYYPYHRTHINPVGPVGGPGHGYHHTSWHGGTTGAHHGYHGSTYYHHNPPGPRGGWGRGHTVVHHNPAGPRGGPGRGVTVHHHRRIR